MKKLRALLAGGVLMLTAGTAMATATFPSGYENNSSPLWGITDARTSQTTGFTLYFENAVYQSDFGLFNVNDTTKPTAIKGDIFQIFSYNQNPNIENPTEAAIKFRYNLDHWEASLNGVAPWKNFDPIFGFYFGVHKDQNPPDVDYRYYTLTSLNSPDPGFPHILVGYNSDINTARIWLEDLPYGQSDLDYDDMRISVTDVAPVPEPGTMVLLGAGFLGLAIYGKRRKNA